MAPGERSVRREVFGFEVVLVSVEDLLVDRLGAWAYWKSGVDGANAFLLNRTCRNEIDENRLTSRAREVGFESALKALRAFDGEWSESEPDLETLEDWANKGFQGEST